MPTPPPKVLAEYKGYTITVPTSGGKAGKGYAKTSNVQVRDRQFCIPKMFQFNVGDAESIRAAARKAREWVDANPIDEHTRKVLKGFTP